MGKWHVNTGATKRKRSTAPGLPNPVASVMSQPTPQPVSFGVPSQPPPRHAAYGMPYGAVMPPGDHGMSQLNGMGGLQMMNGPYSLYPNTNPPPLYMEALPASNGVPPPVQRSKSGGNGKGRGATAAMGPGGSGCAGSSVGSPARQAPQVATAPPLTLPPDIYLPGSNPMAANMSTSYPPHAPRPPTHGTDYDVLQGLGVMPVLPPGVSLFFYCPPIAR